VVAALRRLGTISEISLTLFVTAIAIKFDRLTGAFARSATIFSTRLWLARTRWIPAFLFVSHDFPLENRSHNRSLSLT